MLEGFRHRLLPISLAAIIAVCLAVVPRFAFADDFEGGGGGSHGFGGSYPNWGTVWYGPKKTSNTVGTTYYQYGVVAYTKYDAALYNLDIDESLYGELTNKKKSKLISGSNDFKDFADIFKVGKPDLDPSLIFNTDYAVISSWKSACDLYGETYCYSAMYTLAQKQAARDYVISILQQSDGGEGGGATGGVEIKISNTLVFAGNGEKYAGDSLTVNFTENQMEWLTNNGFIDQAFSVITKRNGANGQIWIAAATEPLELVYVDGKLRYLKNNNASGVRVIQRLLAAEQKSENVWDVTSIASGSNGNLGSGKTWDWSGVAYISIEGGGDSGGGDDDPEPPVTWPKEPTTPKPDPPVVPTPPEPDPPDPPDPTPPDPPTPWLPIPGPDDDPITGDEFQDLIDALAEHCKHIRDNITENVGQLWTNQSELLVTEFSSTRDTLTDNLQWLGTDVIANGFSDLSGYLNDLFQWLADQMQFNINVEGGQYDDTSVVYWLKRIWSKLGTGDINVRPTDPVTDNDGWWEYLLQLMDNFVSFLLGFGLDKLGDVGSSLQTLTGKFPFSLPWDLAALFGLLVAPPQTPSIDFPQYTVDVGGIQQVGTYHLSLESYNDAWEQVRWLERVGFCVLLIKSSDFFAGILGKVFGK